MTPYCKEFHLRTDLILEHLVLFQEVFPISWPFPNCDYLVCLKDDPGWGGESSGLLPPPLLAPDELLEFFRIFLKVEPRLHVLANCRSVPLVHQRGLTLLFLRQNQLDKVVIFYVTEIVFTSKLLAFGWREANKMLLWRLTTYYDTAIVAARLS